MSSRKRKPCLSCQKNETTGKWCLTCAPRERAILIKQKYDAGCIASWEYTDTSSKKESRRQEFLKRMAGVRYDL